MLSWLYTSPHSNKAARVRTSSDAASCACMSEFQSTSNRILCRSWWRGNATSGKPCLWANASISCMHSSKEATELSRQLSAQQDVVGLGGDVSTLHVIAVFVSSRGCILLNNVGNGQHRIEVSRWSRNTSKTVPSCKRKERTPSTSIACNIYVLQVCYCM